MRGGFGADGFCEMTDEIKAVSARETRLGGWSFFFLAMGLVGPFFGALAAYLVNSIRSLSTADPGGIALGLRFFLLAIALVLGIFGRRSRLGRIAMLGSAIVFVVVLGLVSMLFSRHAVRPVSAPTPAPTISQPPPTR